MWLDWVGGSSFALYEKGTGFERRSWVAGGGLAVLRVPTTVG